MTARPLILAAAAALSACASPPPADPALAQELAVWLTGTFSSHAQHLRQRTDFDSFRIVTLPIWLDRDDGPWLYVERARSDSLTLPYRQRVYHLVATGGDAVRSDIFTLPDEPLAWSGAWRRAAPLADLVPEDLIPRTGCSIALRRASPYHFEGATEGDGCRSQRAAADFATAEVTVTPRHLTIWHRGYDLAGRQIWGATAGPYVFDKLAPSPPSE